MASFAEVESPERSDSTVLIWMTLRLITQRPKEFFFQNSEKFFKVPQSNTSPGGNATMNGYDIFFNMASHIKGENVAEFVANGNLPSPMSYNFPILSHVNFESLNLNNLVNSFVLLMTQFFWECLLLYVKF